MTAMAFAMSSRRIYDADHARIDLNQNLRAAMEIVSADIRQAGERLPTDFPAIGIEDGDELPDRLVVRRNLLDTVLLLCADLPPGQPRITVGLDHPGTLEGCARVADDDEDDWPENLDRWRDARLAAGGAMPAYIYDPTDGTGEFFTYEAEDAVGLTIESEQAQWDKTYRATNHCRVYLLEERRYELAGGLLQFVQNEDVDQPRRIVDDVVDLRLIAHFQNGSEATSLDFTDDWRSLRALEVQLVGRRTLRGRSVDRTWSSEIMPRNVLSR
jgi:type IV pilus assembly protein PilW